MALKQGADEIVAVDLDAIGFIRDPREELDETNSRVTRIRPYWNLGASFGFDKNIYDRNKSLGYSDAMKAFNRLEGMYFTFKLGECHKNIKKLNSGLDEAIVRITQMLKRPVAKTLQTIDKRSAIGFLSRGDWETDREQMLCRVAETAGLVFNLSPEKTYTFNEYNNELLREYTKQGGIFNHFKSDGADITSILAAVSHAVDGRKITAQIAQLMMVNSNESEVLWTLAELLPREFVSAIYLKLLIESGGISPTVD